MKNLILASLLAVVSVSASAEVISSALLGTGMFGTTVNAVDCVTKSSDKVKNCYFAATSSTVLVAAVLREEVAQVVPDAQHFLAGEEMTLALEEQMDNIRNQIPEAQDLSDEEVAVMILEISEIK